MLLGGAIAVLKIGFSEIVKGLESIDKRLESIEERNHRN